MSSNFLIVCIVLVGLAVHVSLCSPELPQADDNLNIYALPVGQGDCTVIQCPRTGTGNGKGVVTIIDAGTKRIILIKKLLLTILKEQQLNISSSLIFTQIIIASLILYFMDIQKHH